MTSTFRTPQRRKLEARALTDPKPVRVSMVRAGANQTPVRVIKSADILSFKESTDMTDTIKKMKSDGQEIARITFPKGDAFSDEASVRKWLEDGGYEGAEITVTKEGFEVVNEKDDFEGELTQVTSEDLGVTVFIGKLKTEEEPEETDPLKVAAEKAAAAGSAIEKFEIAAKGGKGDAGSATTEKTENDNGFVFDGEAHVVATPEQVAEHDEVLEGSRLATKVELLSGDCGPGMMTVSAGGVTFCVPTGDRSPISNPTEVIAPAAGGGQNAAGFGGTSPAAGQTQRTDEEIAAEKEAAEKAELTDEQKAEKAEIERQGKLAGTMAARFRGESVILTDDESRQKFDDFMAFFSDGMSLEEVLRDASDGFPPGLMEVINATVVAIRNNVLAGDVSAIRSVAGEFGEIAAALAGLFPATDEQVAERAIDQMFGTAKKADAEAGGETTETPVAALDGAQEVTETTAPVETPKPGSLDDTLGAVLGVMKDTLVAVQKTAEGVGQVNEKVEGLGTRVTDLEAGKQTRKSADVDESQSAEQPHKDKSGIGDLALRGSLGIANTPAR